MKYGTAHALRTALEQRINATSEASGMSHDRLRRRVVVERIVARLHQAESGAWVVKGGMALELRLGDKARLTKDLDLGLRGSVAGEAALQERLVETLSADPDNDRFVLAVRSVRRLLEDDGGRATWRAQVDVALAAKPFGSIQLDVSPRTHELNATDRLPLSNALEFAGIATPTVEVIDLHRHVAEKLHAMLRVFPDRENTRVRDLADIVLLSERGLIEPALAAQATRLVWSQRATELPSTMPELSATWLPRYEALAQDVGLSAATYPQAVALAARLWAKMFAREES